MPQIFPYYLAISQAFVPAVIQIADLTGPLGVTALMLAFNGALVGRLASLARAVCGSPGAGWLVAGVLIVADLAYGAVRLHQVDARRAAAPKVRTGARAGQRRHPREVGSARVRAPARHPPARVGRAGARGRRADRLARVVVSVRLSARAGRLPAGLPARRSAPGARAASTRRCCSARSLTPWARRTAHATGTRTTPRS